jgi:predicted TIM-barrel fold metal-dependent hydrolase
MKRRSVLKNLSALAGVGTLPGVLNAQGNIPVTPYSQTQSLRKIATEEAFTIPEIASAYKELVQKGGTNLDLLVLKQIYDAPIPDTKSKASNDVSNRDKAAQGMLSRLLDVDSLRLADMDANDVSMHLLSLTMPGVQILAKMQAVELAKLANDRLSEAVKRNPSRFAGLGCFAPQDPQAAVKEMQRVVNSLKLNGFIVNSHTNNLYLDDPSFFPILEAAEALNAPIYIHPRAVSDGMAQPFRDYRLEGAAWGYGVETSTHILRLIFGGIFDRLPKLQVVIGHMGEALPFWLWRLDFMGAPGARAGRKNQLKPSEYFQRNITITTSGVEDPLALRYCIDKIGVDRIMWAIDYPYQPTSPSVSFLESAPLSSVEREKIAYKNAERIFSIKN